MKAVSVLLPLSVSQSYDYLTDEALTLGQFVRVPLRNKQVVGCVWRLAGESNLPKEKLRAITEVLNFVPPLPPASIKFIDWVADYTLAPKGAVLKLAMSPPTLFKEPKRKIKPKAIAQPSSLQPLPQWTAPQQTAISEVEKIITAGGYQNILLEGITGSGKTEINFHLMLQAIEKQGGQALFLLPEIALANDMLKRFQLYSDKPIGIWHSAMTPAQRRAQWLEVALGKIKVMIGARSALFLPFADLKIIIVDEEHDEGFKQADGVIYHARDMAQVRALQNDIPIILSSATPCLETLYNVEQKKCHRVKITKRVQAHVPLPEVRLIDMRSVKKQKGKQGSQWLAPTLVEAMKERLELKEQTLLFLNRRGFAPLLLCRRCGFRFSCPDCTSWLSHHHHNRKLLCHYCGFSQAEPSACPQCATEDSLTPCGPGIERIAEEVEKLFPSATIACLSRDLPADIEERSAILQKMKAGEIDILIGTQLIAKGHHFPNLTLAGVVDADLGLANADLRAAERCFQLLQQVAGRTGREHLPGAAFLQTYNPDHPVMQALMNNDKSGFNEMERKSRRALNYPPFGRLAAIILSSEDKEGLETYVRKMAKAAPSSSGAPDRFQLFGPAPAPIFRWAKRYRWRFLIKGKERPHAFVRTWLKHTPALPAHIRRQIDIDPHSFL